MAHEIIVGMGEMGVVTREGTLTALGLGSCVAVILFDSAAKIAGCAHVMLPDSQGAVFEPPQRTVMIAEADTNVRRTIKEILLAASCTVIAETGEQREMLSLYQRHKPSLSIVSVFLPPQNWQDAVVSLRGVDRLASVLLLSPPVESHVLMEYLFSGAHEVVTNPFTREKVVDGVEYVLNLKAYKFADRAIPMLKRRLALYGADPARLVAKIVGGAHMFPSLAEGDVMNIGKKNVESVKTLLHAAGIPIAAEETGAHVGRTIRFDVATGTLLIRTKDGEKAL